MINENICKKFKKQYIIYNVLYYLFRIIVFIYIIYLLKGTIFRILYNKPKIENVSDLEINTITELNFQINNEQNKLINIIGDQAIIGYSNIEIKNIFIKDSISKSNIYAKSGSLDTKNKNIILYERPKITILN